MIAHLKVLFHSKYKFHPKTSANLSHPEHFVGALSNLCDSYPPYSVVLSFLEPQRFLRHWLLADLPSDTHGPHPGSLRRQTFN